MARQISMLITLLDKHKGVVSYQSKADISSYTRLALQDAITMMSLINNIQLNSRHEQSIFSQQPDHVVVFDVESNLPIIAVEDRKPAPENLAKTLLGKYLTTLFHAIFWAQRPICGLVEYGTNICHLAG
jgi:hypothetical protein